jgi:hypothetical protein
MARLRSILLSTILLALTGPPNLHAQYAVGVGLTVPTHEWSATHDPGWMVALGYSPWRSGSGAFRLWTQGYVGVNGGSTPGTESTKSVMAGLGLSYKFLPPSASPAPYLIAATGYLHRSDPSGGWHGGPYVGAGAGVSVGRYWLQGRFQVARIAGGPLAFLLIAGGTSF